MDWAETRLPLQLWLHQSWPFRTVCLDLRSVLPGETMTEAEMVERYRMDRFAEMLGSKRAYRRPH